MAENQVQSEKKMTSLNVSSETRDAIKDISTSLHRGSFGSAHDDALDPLDRLIEDGRYVERSLHAGSGVRVVAVDQVGDGIGLREAKARADVLYGVTGLR